MLIENSVAVEFTPLKDFELLKWANDKLKEFDASADKNALDHLIALVGQNVRRLTNEIEKLAVAALPEKIITVELVESLVSNSREISNFDLTDNLMAKNKSKALQVLKKILDDGVEPLMILGLIASNFHRLSLAKELMANGVERGEVARIMKLPPYQAGSISGKCAPRRCGKTFTNFTKNSPNRSCRQDLESDTANADRNARRRTCQFLIRDKKNTEAIFESLPSPIKGEKL